MDKTVDKKLEIETFLTDVASKVKEGMEYVDAMQLCALYTSGKLPSLVTQAIDKYQEATYGATKLSQQENVDECALAVWECSGMEKALRVLLNT